jgi:hypothetical protein
MKTELDLGYTLEIYEKGNYGTVKRKYFEDMLDLVTFTNTKARNYNTDYIIDVINKTEFKTRYKGCIHTFNRKVNEILIQGDYSINN